MDLIEAGSRIERLGNSEAVWQAALEALDQTGFPFVIYLSSDAARTSVELRTNIPEIYGDTSPADDPFLTYCCDSFDATLTGPEYLATHDYLPESAREFIVRASATGFISGFGIPMRLEGSPRFGGFNIGTGLKLEAFESAFKPKLEILRVFCLLVHRKLEELGAGSTEVLSKLSPREREVVTMIANGASRKECARAMSISPNTVAEYTKSAYKKLGVKNRGEAAQKLRG